MRAIYEGAFTGNVEVEIIGKYETGLVTKFVCRVTKGNSHRRAGEVIHTGILFLWNSIKYVGSSVQYVGKPDVSSVPVLSGESET